MQGLIITYFADGLSVFIKVLLSILSVLSMVNDILVPALPLSKSIVCFTDLFVVDIPLTVRIISSNFNPLAYAGESLKTFKITG